MTDGNELAGRLLDSAADIVRANDTHGDAITNQQHIAAGWTWYLRGTGLLADDQSVTGSDVGNMMGLLKMSRAAVGEHDIDHHRDIAGYSAIGAACIATSNDASPTDLDIEDPQTHE